MSEGVGQAVAGLAPPPDTLSRAGGRAQANTGPAKLDLLSSQIHLLTRTVITLLKRLNRSYLSTQIPVLSPASRYTAYSLSAVLHTKGTGIGLLRYIKVI